jgi:hypothetical protein
LSVVAVLFCHLAVHGLTVSAIAARGALISIRISFSP